MKAQSPRHSTPPTKVLEQPTPKVDDQKTASGRDRWSAVQHVRLPHKVGLPLSSGSCGDAIER